MTDRYNYLIVALERDIREDDAADLLKCIQCLKGVLKVEPHVADADSFVAEQRIRAELRQELMKFLTR